MAVIAYVQNVFAGLSHLLNSILLGDPRQSFSARVGAAAYTGERWAEYAEAAINLALFSRNHCREQAHEAGLI